MASNINEDLLEAFDGIVTEALGGKTEKAPTGTEPGDLDNTLSKSADKVYISAHKQLNDLLQSKNDGEAVPKDKLENAKIANSNAYQDKNFKKANLKASVEARKQSAKTEAYDSDLDMKEREFLRPSIKAYYSKFPLKDLQSEYWLNDDSKSKEYLTYSKDDLVNRLTNILIASSDSTSIMNLLADKNSAPGHATCVVIGTAIGDPAVAKACAEGTAAAKKVADSPEWKRDIAKIKTEAAFEYGVDSDSIGFDELIEEAEYLDLDEDTQSDQATKRLDDQKAKAEEDKKKNLEAKQSTVAKAQAAKSAIAATDTDKTNAKNSINLAKKRTDAQNAAIDKKIDSLNAQKQRIIDNSKATDANAAAEKKEEAAKNIHPAKFAQPQQLGMGGNVVQPAAKKPANGVLRQGGVLKEADIVTLQSLKDLPEYNISRGKDKNLLMKYDITNQSRDKINSDNITHQKAEEEAYSGKVGKAVEYYIKGAKGDFSDVAIAKMDEAKKANDVSVILRKIFIELRKQSPSLESIRTLKFKLGQALQVAFDVYDSKLRRKR